MGCYNVSGGLSGLNIEEFDKCVFFPLFPDKDFHSHKHTTNLVSNKGAYIFYTPFSLPIVGYYDDYGCLKNIEKSANTKMIEDFFGCCIQDFLNEITDKREQNITKNEDIMKMLGGMF